MKFSDEKQIADLVRSFEEATIARDRWKHAEHLTVALYYITLYDLDTATSKMRAGIFKLLKAFEVDLSKEMPYHETLTVFWMRTVAEFNSLKGGDPLRHKANELVDKYGKDYPLRFYTREYLFSDEARARFVEPDIEQLGPN